MRFRVIVSKFVIVGLLCCSIKANAGDLDKAFKYLNTGDYPNARRYLQEAFNDEPENAATNYGLAKYYSLRDNKQYDLDSANIFIKRANANPTQRDRPAKGVQFGSFYRK